MQLLSIDFYYYYLFFIFYQYIFIQIFIKKLIKFKIVNSNLDDWNRQHRILARSFGPKLIHSMSPAMHSITETVLFGSIERSIDSNIPLNILDTFRQLSMQIIIKTTIGMSEEKAAKLLKNVFFLTSIYFFSIFSYFSYIYYFYKFSYFCC